MKVGVIKMIFFSAVRKLFGFIYNYKYRVLFTGFIISLIIHLAVIFNKMEFKIDEIELKQKPLSMKFVQRAPRLVKPMELRKKPKIVQRKFVRPTAQTKSFTPRSMRTTAMHGGTVLASLARPSDPVSRVMSILPDEIALGPDLSDASRVVLEKEDDRKSLDEQLLNTSDLDIGRYSAMVIQNPNNKKDVRGYFHMYKIKYDDQGYIDWRGNPGYNSEPLAMQHVSEYVERYSDVKIDFESFITFDDPKIVEQPFIYLAGESGCLIKMRKEEIEGLRNFLLAGGFLLVDDTGSFKGGPFDRRVRGYLKEALGEKYVEKTIPRDHQIYHCFFDFDSPPMGSDLELGKNGASRAPEKDLDGVWVDGRLAVAISNKGFGILWDLDRVFTESHFYEGLDLTRQYQFGVNIIIYALIHEGGMVSRQLSYK